MYPLRNVLIETKMSPRNAEIPKGTSVPIGYGVSYRQVPTKSSHIGQYHEISNFSLNEVG